MTPRLGETVLVHISKRVTKNCSPTRQGTWRCDLCGCVVGEDDAHKLMDRKSAKELSRHTQQKWVFGKNIKPKAA